MKNHKSKFKNLLQTFHGTCFSQQVEFSEIQMLNLAKIFAERRHRLITGDQNDGVSTHCYRFEKTGEG